MGREAEGGVENFRVGCQRHTPNDSEDTNEPSYTIHIVQGSSNNIVVLESHHRIVRRVYP